MAEVTEFAAPEEVTLKFLVPNYAIGAIIGKAGATITQIQANTSTRMKISQNGAFFPGTRERVALIVGTAEAVIAAAQDLIERIAAVPPAVAQREPTNAYHSAVPRSSETLLAVPAASAGALIGKGGEVIKSIQGDTGSTLRISPKENAEFSLNERFVTVSGTVAQMQRTVEVIVEKLLAEEAGLEYNSLSLQYDDFVNYEYSEGDYHASKQSNVPCTITIPVPDEMVGFIVGKAGKTILEMQYKSGATITVSGKGEYVAGTTNRTIKIVGPIQAAQAAHILVQQKIDFAASHPLQDQ